MKKFTHIILLLSIFVSALSGQTVINGFAKITNVNATILDVTNVNEANATFEAGDEVLLYQVQDDVIGTNTGDDEDFGKLGVLSEVGTYEIATIQTIIEAAGAPIRIILSQPLSKPFNFGANSSLQLITYPTFGSPDYTTVSDLTTIAWDGNIGGVLAFKVDGVLTLEHDIEVDNLGFRGAAANGGGSTRCTGSSNYRRSSTGNFADKGEGIYKSTNSNYAAGFAPILTGGGGGNSHNAGGGGGSNFSEGGRGGEGWPTCSPSAGGYGGINMFDHINFSRFILGGGGGAGEANNNGGQPGGNGGGLIFINADEIRTAGACSGRSITANGEGVTNSANQDGNSGGGAGGSIFLNTRAWDVSSTCPLTVESNGGVGGDVAHRDYHGAGGGGGLGAVIYADQIPDVNDVTTNTSPGLGGKNCNTCDVTNPGGGVNQDGIITIVTLPVELVAFSANCGVDEIELKWTTASEINNEGFYIQNSFDGITWHEVEFVSGHGNKFTASNYSLYVSKYGHGNYYRLKQMDFDGAYDYSKSLVVNCSVKQNLRLFPNPSTGIVQISSPDLGDETTVIVYSVLGKKVEPQVNIAGNDVQLNFNSLPKGTYAIQVLMKYGRTETHRVVII